MTADDKFLHALGVAPIDEPAEEFLIDQDTCHEFAMLVRAWLEAEDDDRTN